jgi:hypothetical protein
LMDDLGDPRGDFIRLQIRLASRKIASDQELLRQLEAELLCKHRSRWNQPLHQYLGECGLKVRTRGSSIRKWNYERGFVSHLAIDAITYMNHHAAIAKLGPIQHARFYQAWRAGEALFRSPTIKHLRSMAIVADSLRSR